MSTFTAIGAITPGSRARSSSVNDLNSNAAAAFALLPNETKLSLGTATAAIDTGTANTYLVSMPTTPVGYADNMAVVMIPKTSNTGASTINVDSLGVVAIKLQDGSSALGAGDIVVGVPVEMRYSSVTGCFHINQAPDVYRVLTVYTKITSTTLIAAEVSGLNTVHNDGAGAEVILTWPALETGQEAVFYINDAQYLQIKAPAGVTIRIGAVTSAAAGYVRSNVVGSWIRIKAMPDGLVVFGSGGVWTYDE